MDFILDTKERKAEIESIPYRLRRFEYVRTLRTDKQIPILKLIQSLRFDGRFYGAGNYD